MKHLSWVVFLMGIVPCAGCLTFNAPMPRCVKISGWKLSRIKAMALRETNPMEVDTYLAGLANRLGGVDRNPERHSYDLSGTPNVWEQALDIYVALHAKADAGWPGLESLPSGTAMHMKLDPNSPVQYIKTKIYGEVVGTYMRENNPIKVRFAMFYNDIRPDERELLRWWRENASRGGVPIGDTR